MTESAGNHPPTIRPRVFDRRARFDRHYGRRTFGPQFHEIERDHFANQGRTKPSVDRAQILLKADADGPAWTDARIADAFGCRSQTIDNIRQRLVQNGFRGTFDGKKRAAPPTPKLLDGEQEARIIATRLGPPSKGYANWALRLLAGQVVELEIVDAVSYATLCRTLKKHGMNNRKMQYWVIPPEADAEFVANMEAGRCCQRVHVYRAAFRLA
ncbi:MAG: helix-turn-helix domain-containing protein [Planctomycetales bacterium]|nr:helix-turn-helix domain-containing protein [Planctomycetales bacterium]